LPAINLRNGWYTENDLMLLPIALAHGAFVGASGDGRFSSAARADYAAAAAVALTADNRTGQTYELAADSAFSMAELAGEVARQPGKAIVYNDLTAVAYQGVLTGAGLRTIWLRCRLMPMPRPHAARCSTAAGRRRN
jgi:NAD(P)H dehydrogenase (quinone)